MSPLIHQFQLETGQIDLWYTLYLLKDFFSQAYFILLKLLFVTNEIVLCLRKY